MPEQPAAQAGPSPRSPHTGDRVRAVGSDRTAEKVEGILDLRLVPHLDYVQVNVLTDDGRAVHVAHETIEVLEPQAITLDEMVAGEPLRHDKGWHPIVDLDQMAAEGYLKPTPPVVGGTWSEMFAALHRLLQPMAEAGWQLEEISMERDRDGDSVFIDAVRDGDRIQFEYVEDGWVTVWRTDLDGDDPEYDPSDSFLFDCGRATVPKLRKRLKERGWLDPA